MRERNLQPGLLGTVSSTAELWNHLAPSLINRRRRNSENPPTINQSLNLPLVLQLVVTVNAIVCPSSHFSPNQQRELNPLSRYPHPYAREEYLRIDHFLQAHFDRYRLEQYCSSAPRRRCSVYANCGLDFLLHCITSGVPQYLEKKPVLHARHSSRDPIRVQDTTLPAGVSAVLTTNSFHL